MIFIFSILFRNLLKIINVKILSAGQIRNVDHLTVERQHITSLELMERAASRCVTEIKKIVLQSQRILVVCGMGNNGGDGLAIARLLHGQGYSVQIVIVYFKMEFSNDTAKNYERLPENIASSIIEIRSEVDLDSITINHETTIIDALFGTGVNRSLSGLPLSVIYRLNQSNQPIISIDIPSGLFAFPSEEIAIEKCIHSTITLTFQAPKLSFLLPEYAQVCPQFKIIDIDLETTALQEQMADYFYLEHDEIKSLIQPRNKFSHKGTYGHALLYAGSTGKSGAAIMASEACLRSGAGLLTVHSTEQVVKSLNIRLPEAMTEIDKNKHFISEYNSKNEFSAIGFGPGVGTNDESGIVLKFIIQNYKKKLVIDADGLNLLAENKTWLEFLPSQTILTPHPKEFDRLFGQSTSAFERLQKAKEFCLKTQTIIVLKGAHTAICLPNGKIFFNSSGNPCLAKGGSGDVLTGIILGLLTRGYPPSVATIIGVYTHGLAADLCVTQMSVESVLATDIVKKLVEAFKVVGG